MPSPRLSELRRQRFVIQEHLAWLEREIERVATEEGTVDRAPGDVVGTPISADAPTAATPIANADAPAAGTSTEAEVPPDYQALTSDVQRDVRRGCFIYFALALALLVIGVAGMYLAFRH